MKHRSPKQLRIDKKKPRQLTGAWNIETTSIIVHGSRVDKLPSFEEYNPNRIHVARRRRAYKDHHTFPRGWTWNTIFDDDVTGSGWSVVDDPDTTATVFKENDLTWYMNGEKVS